MNKLYDEITVVTNPNTIKNKDMICFNLGDGNFLVRPYYKDTKADYQSFYLEIENGKYEKAYETTLNNLYSKKSPGIEDLIYLALTALKMDIPYLVNRYLGFAKSIASKFNEEFNLKICNILLHKKRKSEDIDVNFFINEIKLMYFGAKDHNIVINNIINESVTFEELQTEYTEEEINYFKIVAALYYYSTSEVYKADRLYNEVLKMKNKTPIISYYINYINTNKRFLSNNKERVQKKVYKKEC